MLPDVAEEPLGANDYQGNDLERAFARPSDAESLRTRRRFVRLLSFGSLSKDVGPSCLPKPYKLSTQSPARNQESI